MIKKITLITILLLGNIAFSQEPKLTDKYLFATLKGKIDDKHDITMNIKISISYSWTGEMSGYVSGNYHYDRFGKNIYFTKGTINKNSMIIEAEGNEVFTFKLGEATLNKILELKTSSKKITINGNWEKGYEEFSCVINSVSPLGGKLSEVYKYNISGEATYDREYNYDGTTYNGRATFEYDGDALYSPSINVSYFTIINQGYPIYTNENIDIDTLKNIMKENLKKGISNTGVIGAHFTNDFRIGYFDDKILCIEEYADEFSGGAHGEIWYNYNIISLETGKRLSNDFYEDLVDYSEEFKEFFKKEFIDYHTISSEEDYINRYLSEEDKNNKEFLEYLKKEKEVIRHNKDLENYLENSFDYDFPKPKQSDDSYYLPTFFIFNNDGTVDIYHDYLPFALYFFRKTKIEMKKLKPYIKKDSFYRYLFD